MSPEFLTIGMFVTLIVFIVLGLPLAYSLAGTALIFGLLENGFNVDGLLGFFINNAWGTMNNFVLVAVPLFILMAQLLDRAKISDALFEALYVVMGRIKGGLGLAVIFVCVILAATTGIVGASVVGMTLLAGPKLLEKGYNKKMAAGLICSGGSLGILIPPSIMLVVFGGLTGLKETSVGALFAAAIAPGMLLALLYMGYVFVVCQVKPTYGPAISAEEASTYSSQQKMWMVIKSMVPPLVLIFAVMGTILGGVATPSEAAGVGVLGAAILALARGNLNWQVIFDSCKATLRTTSMVMILVLFGNLFSATFLFVGGGDVITDLLIGGNLPPGVVLSIMLLAVFVLGMFIDWVAILLVCLPVYMPVSMELGFDPLWFSMLICIVMQTSFLTPPFGYSLFYFAGAAPVGTYRMIEIYKGVTPFIILQALGTLLCILFPALITYIPSIVFG
ncbi:MAG TPA: TRAP transporter large permease subunit [Desulfobacteraceae bacterium]|nr:TRAP transporter large permease subunit [Desulfobacteraceae bacterium]